MSYFGDSGFVVTSPTVGGNTTTTTLSGSATYTGTSELNDFDAVACDVRSDVAGTVYFQFSVNNSDWVDYPAAGFSLTAGGSVVRSAKKLGRYFRLKIVNGSSAQTYLRAYVYYGSFDQLGSPLNQSILGDAVGQSVRPTVAQDEVIRGAATYVSQFGYRTVTTAATGEETIWGDSSNLTIMTTADTFDIAYVNSTDGAATTGALELTFEYLDANHELQEAAHTLGGSGSDTTSFTGLGVNKVTVTSSGSTNHNVDAITVTDTTGGTTQAYIAATYGITQQLLFHCPANSIPIIKDIFIATEPGGLTPKVDFALRTYNRLQESTLRMQSWKIDAALISNIDYKRDIKLKGRDVVYITADTDTDNIVVSGSFSLNIYDSI